MGLDGGTVRSRRLAVWVKHDGLRSLAYIENGTCKLVSRKKYDYQRFTDLRDALPDEFNAKDAILDGELVVLDSSGRRASTT